MSDEALKGIDLDDLTERLLARLNKKHEVTPVALLPSFQQPAQSQEQAQAAQPPRQQYQQPPPQQYQQPLPQQQSQYQPPAPQQFPYQPQALQVPKQTQSSWGVHTPSPSPAQSYPALSWTTTTSSSSATSGSRSQYPPGLIGTIGTGSPGSHPSTPVYIDNTDANPSRPGAKMHTALHQYARQSVPNVKRKSTVPAKKKNDVTFGCQRVVLAVPSTLIVQPDYCSGRWLEHLEAHCLKANFSAHPDVLQSDDASTVQMKIAAAFRGKLELNVNSSSFSWAAAFWPNKSSMDHFLIPKGHASELNGKKLHEIFQTGRLAVIYLDSVAEQPFMSDLAKKLEEAYPAEDQDDEDDRVDCQKCKKSFPQEHMNSHVAACTGRKTTDKKTMVKKENVKVKAEPKGKRKQQTAPIIIDDAGESDSGPAVLPAVACPAPAAAAPLRADLPGARTGSPLREDRAESGESSGSHLSYSTNGSNVTFKKRKKARFEYELVDPNAPQPPVTTRRSTSVAQRAAEAANEAQQSKAAGNGPGVAPVNAVNAAIAAAAQSRRAEAIAAAVPNIPPYDFAEQERFLAEARKTFQD
ncbi:hypothetical protein P7C73_g615, partial [Tremellales sp. Uapishka_1]